VSARSEDQPPRPGGAATVAQRVVAALALPGQLPPETARPLPLPALHLVVQDGSLVYDLGSVDISGRVASLLVVTAVGWEPGDRLDLVIADGAIVFRRSSDGLWPVTQRPRICIPAHARHQLGISQGDQVLLAAAPAHSLLIVYPAGALNEMITSYHVAHSRGGHEHE